MAYLLAPGTTVEHSTRNPKIDFHSFFLINFNSTALFKNAFLVLDLGGRPFGGDFKQLSPCKMKKHMVPIARLANRIHWRLCLTPLPPGNKVEHFTRNPKNDFHSFFFRSISIAQLFSKMHFWCSIWPGSRLFVILSSSNLVPVK